MRLTGTLITVLSAIALTGHAQSPPARASLRGKVVAAATGTPLRHARIQATIGGLAIPPVLTDADGQFVLADLAGNPSRLSASKPGYLPVSVPLPRSPDLTIRLPKAGAISGRITSSLGDPLIGMTVMAALATDPDHKSVATAQTDDLGDYRISGLPEGHYLVGVSSVSPVLGLAGEPLTRESMVNGRTLTPDDVIRQTGAYYPGVAAIADAGSIALATGEERSTIDFAAPVARPADMLGALTSTSAPRDRGASASTAAIRGRVLAPDGRALPQAMVRLLSDYPSVIPPAVTDQEGRYEFRRLGAGTFKLSATRAGFLSMEYGRRRPSDSGEAIDLRPGEVRENIDIALPRPATIAGRIVDETGEPMEGVVVHLLQVEYRGGRRRLVEAGGEGRRRTDDRGAYRIYGLMPGTYIVSGVAAQLSATPPVADLPGYATSYFPGTVDPGAAARVTVGLSEERTGLDFALVPAPTFRIAGTIVDASGKPVSSGLILTPSRRSSVLAVEPGAARMDRDGGFEFMNVISGEYVIQASQGRNNNVYAEGESLSQFVTVNGADVTGLVLRMSSGSTLKGHVTFEGRAYPELYSALDLQAVPTDMDLTPQNLGNPASARIQPDGTFELAAGIGPRVLRLTQAPQGWMLKSVILNDRDVTDTPLTFGAADQPPGTFTVVVTDRGSEVHGRAVDAAGSGVAGLTVVIFSTDRDRWTETSRFLAVGQTARDGAFRVEKLAAGDYYVAAVASIDPGEWRDPALLEALVPGAPHVSLSEGDAVTTVVRARSR